MTDAVAPLSPAAQLLPARANLEHLKKEAKQQLKAMRQGGPGASLARAQLAVARRYGFPSWRKLKSFVDALHDSGERLVNAVRTGDLDIMRAVLRQSPELVNATTDLEDRFRPSDTLAMRLLHLAVAENQAAALQLLIENGADPNARNASGRLPLHDCFELGRDELAQRLLAAGAEADVCAAAAYGMLDRLRDLLEHDPAQANDLRTGLSPLGWSAYGNQPEAARTLIAHGAIVNRPPYDWQAWGPTAHIANLHLARVLLSHGADPNCRDEAGNTPVHVAIKSRIVEDPTAFVELLLAQGANPAMVNHHGRTARDEALLQVGKTAETYYPAQPIAEKKLQRVIALLSRP